MRSSTTTQTAELNSEKIAYYTQVGIECHEKGNLAGAINYYTKVLEFNPKDVIVLYNLGVAYQEQIRDQKDREKQHILKKAILSYTTLLEEDPKHVNANFNLGMAYYENSKNYENNKTEKELQLLNAITSFKQALSLEIDKKQVPAYVQLGRAYYKLNKLDEAIKNYEAALNFDRKNAYIYYYIGLVNCRQRNFSLAKSNYKLAQKFGFADPDIDYRYGLLYEKEGNFIDAFKKHTEALEKGYLLASKELENVLYIMGKNDLDKLDKKKLFSAIKLLPDEKQISILELCINEATKLGERFWKQEGFRPCSKETGTLKEIVDHLKELEESQRRESEKRSRIASRLSSAIPSSTSSSTSPSSSPSTSSSSFRMFSKKGSKDTRKKENTTYKFETHGL